MKTLPAKVALENERMTSWEGGEGMLRETGFVTECVPSHDSLK